MHNSHTPRILTLNRKNPSNLTSFPSPNVEGRGHAKSLTRSHDSTVKRSKCVSFSSYPLCINSQKSNALRRILSPFLPFPLTTIHTRPAETNANVIQGEACQGVHNSVQARGLPGGAGHPRRTIRAQRSRPGRNDHHPTACSDVGIVHRGGDIDKRPRVGNRQIRSGRRGTRGDGGVGTRQEGRDGDRYYHAGRPSGTTSGLRGLCPVRVFQQTSRSAARRNV